MLTQKDNKTNRGAISSAEALLEGAGQVFNIAGEYNVSPGIELRRGRAYHYQEYSNRLRGYFESAVSKVINEPGQKQIKPTR